MNLSVTCFTCLIGTVAEVVAKKAKLHPAWAEDILAFASHEGFIKHIRNVMPGMKEVLDDIERNGDRIVGLTNWGSDAYDVMSGKVHLKKPSPEIFHWPRRNLATPMSRMFISLTTKPTT